MAEDEKKSSFSWANPLSSLIAAGTSIFNTVQQRKINQENLDYAKSMTQASWERDDTQYQRQVADASAAGLSPLAVLGSSYGNSSPVGYQAQAPQLDTNALTNSLLEQSRLSENARQFDENLEFQNKQLTENSEQFWTSLSNDKQFKDKQLAQDMEKFTQNLNYQNDVLEQTKYQFDSERTFKLFQERQLELRNNLPEDYSIYYCSSFSEYESKHLEWVENYNNFVASLSPDSSSGSGSGNFSLGLLSGNGSIGGSGSSSKDYTSKVKLEIETFLSENPYPVYDKTYNDYYNEVFKKDSK